ncbi:unnamed protein product [Caenorhabditis auriculariae]|uniref:Succinate dehydrogenase assembly factor 3 n=1 Tax=Caenorhabditis auriculariae TaxID=2777116 RepID=A0A8S1H0P6_9PELO|nr:unnamed protein product [Caenorhabditis auriculariae]
MSSRKAVKTALNAGRYPLYLYKNILRLHYGLPAQARLMGDTYVRDEFRRHKTAAPEHVKVFIEEWTNYCVMLSKQLSGSGLRRGAFGKDLEGKIDDLADEQIHQLLELKIEAEKHLGSDSQFVKSLEDLGIIKESKK